MKIGAVITARRKYGRWPDKTVVPIAGKPMICQVVNRVKKLNVDEVIIATSTNIEDEYFTSVANKYNIGLYAGHPTNLLERHENVMNIYNLDALMMIISNYPLFDIGLGNHVIATARNEHPEYDIMGDSCPDHYVAGGSHFCIFTRTAYEKIHQIIEKYNFTNFEQYWVVCYKEPDFFKELLFDYPKIVGVDIFISTMVIYPIDAMIINKVIEKLGYYPDTYAEYLRGYSEITEWI